MVEKLWRLHRRGMSYASDTPAVNMLLAEMSEGIEQAAIRIKELEAATPLIGMRELLREACDLLQEFADDREVDGTMRAERFVDEARAALSVLDGEGSKP